MNIANAVAQADFFDEKGILKEYTPQNQHTGSMYVLKKFQGNPSSNILFSDNGIDLLDEEFKPKDNSATRESNPGIDTRIMTDTGINTTTFPVETDVTAIHAEIPEELQIHSNNYRSVTPTDTQALTALQNLISDDFQAKDTHSTQRKGEKTPDTRSIQRKGEDETFQLIQKIHNQLQQVQWDLQRLHSLHKYKN